MRIVQKNASEMSAVGSKVKVITGSQMQLDARQKA
jgi:hypothetical protein